MIKAVFDDVLHIWGYRNSVHITYEDREGIETERIIDPYALFYHHSTWYLKAYCHLRDDLRTFILNRVISANILDEVFEVPPEYLKPNLSKYPFEYDPIENVEILCSPEIVPFIYSQDDFYIQKNAAQEKDGATKIYIERASKNIIIKWIIAQNGKARVLKPKELTDEIESLYGHINNL